MTASAADQRSRNNSKRNSMSDASVVNSSTSSAGLPAQPQRRASKADIKSVDLGTGRYIPSWNHRNPQPPADVAILGIRKALDHVLLVIRPKLDSHAVEVRLDTLSALDLDRYYKKWDTNAKVAIKLLREVNLRCIYRIDEATGQVQILSTDWPYSNQPRSRQPSFPARTARQATEAVFNGVLGLAVLSASARRR